MVRIRKITIVIWIFSGVFLIILSFFIGRLTANVEALKHVSMQQPQPATDIVGNTLKAKDHSAKAAYEAGWTTCMRCWGITSTEGLVFENAYCSPNIFKNDDSVFMDYIFDSHEPVLISELLGNQDLSLELAKKIFSRGFNDCMEKWSINYTHSSRSGSDDVTYGFNNWY